MLKLHLIDYSSLAAECWKASLELFHPWRAPPINRVEADRDQSMNPITFETKNENLRACKYSLFHSSKVQGVGTQNPRRGTAPTPHFLYFI